MTESNIDNIINELASLEGKICRSDLVNRLN